MRISLFFSFAFLFSLIGLADTIGNASAYLAMLILLVSIPVTCSNSQMRIALKEPTGWFFAAAFALLALALALSAKNIEQFGHIINYLPFLFFFPAYALLSEHQAEHNSLIVGSLALLGTVFAIGQGMYEYYVLDYNRVIGFINLTNPYAMMAVMLGFLSLMGFWATQKKIRYIYLLGPALGTYATIIAGTRSALLIVIACAAVFYICALTRLTRKQRRISYGVLITVALMGAITFLDKADDIRALSAFNDIGQFLRDGTAADYSIQLRLDMYKGGLLAFLDSPIWGHGWTEQFIAAQKYMSGMAANDTQGWTHLHNDYINFAALTGILGLIALALYLLAPIVGVMRTPRDSQFLPRIYGSFVVFFCYSIYGMFDTSFGAEMLITFNVLFAAVLLGYCKDKVTA